MAADKIVFDLETQNLFEEVGGRGRSDLLKISVIGLYSYADDKYYCFEENEVYKAGEMMQAADQIIGFTIKHFDFDVLQPYVNYDVHSLPYLDILEEFVKIAGHRIKLENLAQTNLGMGKSGDGKEAVRMFRQGRIDELKKYCLQDVRVTKEIYDYGQKHGKLLYKDYFDTREIQIAFPEPMVKKPAARQISLF
ncbi:MAG: ribonuclease H-like domain-containing protein [Candidatus Doudnabacteria bacterium]|nr:ribonuclease H-like domain-containing protein [Candidatus Doudnabacteria bacterium]